MSRNGSDEAALPTIPKDIVTEAANLMWELLAVS